MKYLYKLERTKIYKNIINIKIVKNKKKLNL